MGAEKRLLILGVTGMLGSELFTTALENEWDVHGTTRRPLSDDFPPEEFPPQRIHRFRLVMDSVEELIAKVKPDVVINCLGIIKGIDATEEEFMEVNAKFPQELAKVCPQLIQVSTDCVFSGKKGQYTEQDPADPVDLYGKSKLFGEVTDPPHLTIRTSMVGRERGTKKSLLEWFLQQKGTIKGYRQAFWSGLTTKELSRVLLKLAERDDTGLLHVAGERISKYELLHLFRERFEHPVEIEPDDAVAIDRSLDHAKLDALGIVVPSVKEMVNEL